MNEAIALTILFFIPFVLVGGMLPGWLCLWLAKRLQARKANAQNEQGVRQELPEAHGQ